MKKLKKFGIIIGVLLVIGMIGNMFESEESQTNKTTEKKKTVSKVEKKIPPSQDIIDAIQNSLDENGKDRWANWKVGYNEEEENIYIQVAADPSANKVAIKGYIALVKGIHERNAPNFNLVGRIYQMGDLKESFYVNGK